MSQLKLEILLDMANKVSAPLKAMQADTKGLTGVLREARGELRQIENAQRLADKIRKDQLALRDLGKELGIAKAKAKETGEAMAAVGPKTQEQIKAFDKARDTAGKLKERYEQLRAEIDQQKNKLEASAAGTRNLELADRKLAVSQTAAQKAVEQHSAALKRHQLAVQTTAEREERFNRIIAMRDKLQGNGAANVATGVATLAPIGKAIQAHAQFENAMLGVARQVDGARDANGKYTQTYYDMGKEIQVMSQRLPMAANEIAQLAAAAARNGIQGKENIMAMAETAAAASMAFDLPVEQLGDDLSKIAQLYKIPTASIKSLGDTINYLDDQTLAKGGDIIGVMKRMGGQADKIGASNAAAYASTLLSLGETEETAGTSMKAIITKLSAAEKGPKKFKDAFADLGLNTSAIQKQMATDANGAIQTVMNAVAKMPKDQQTGILKDLFGLEHVGQAEKLANNMDELRRQIELTQSAAAKGSMDREVQARLDTTMAKWETLKNKATNAMAKIGAAPQFGTLIDKLGNLAEKIGNFAERHPKLVATVLTGAAAMGTLAVGVGVAQLAFARLLGPVAWAFKAFSWLRKGDGTISGMAKIASVASRVGSALTRMGGVALRAFMMLGRGVMLAGRLMLANPMIAIITGIALAAYLIYKHWGKIYPFIKSLWDRVSNYLSSLASRFASIGADIIGGLWSGLQSRWGAMSSWLSQKIASLPDAARKLLGIQSPSRVFMAIGGHTMDGLHVGLEQRFGRVRDFMTRATQSLIPTVHRPAFAEIGMGQGTQPSMRRSEFATVRQTSAREFRFEMGDIHIHTTSGDPNEIARAVRREIEQVIREAARRERSAMTDKDY